MSTKCDGTKNAMHTKDDGSWWEYDAKGIVIGRVCGLCMTAKLAKFRPDVLTDGQYWADEQIEED